MNLVGNSSIIALIKHSIEQFIRIFDEIVRIVFSFTKTGLTAFQKVTSYQVSIFDMNVHVPHIIAALYRELALNKLEATVFAESQRI